MYLDILLPLPLTKGDIYSNSFRLSDRLADSLESTWGETDCALKSIRGALSLMDTGALHNTSATAIAKPEAVNGLSPASYSSTVGAAHSWRFPAPPHEGR